MKAATRYTLHHPKWYRHPVSVWWWLERWSYTKFVLRELTSVFVAFFALTCLWLLRRLVEGPDAYAQAVERLQHPAILALHAIAFVFILFHALTWFNLAPKAMVVRMGGKRVPDSAIIASNYAAWLVVSAVLAWIWLGR